MADLDAARTALIDIERAHPNQLSILRALAQIEQARASIFQDRDDWIAASVVHENLVRVLGTLRAADPKNAVLTADLAQAHRDFAMASARLGDVAAARKEYAASAARFVEALQAAPDNVGTIRNAVRALLNEASFLEARNEWPAAKERLDRAVEIADALVRQRGADIDGVLTGIDARAARARLANFDGRRSEAVRDLERGEQLLSDAGRPASPAELRRVVAIVAELAVQWGYAGRLGRSLSLVEGALTIYPPPEGVSDAASVEYRISIARLLLQKATAEFDRNDIEAAIATAQRAIALYENDVLPHTRHEWALNGFAQQLIQLGRLAFAAGDKRRARDAYCAVGPKLVALVPKLADQPRLRLTTLEGEFLCAQTRFFMDESDEAAKLADGLATRIDDAVPIDAALMSEWRSIRARVANLRTAIRVVAGDQAKALPFLRTAIRYYEDAVTIPAPESNDLADLAFLREQLADLLNGNGDKAGARTEAEAAIATWRRAVKMNRVNYQLEIKLAEAMMTLGDLWEKDSADKARGFYLQAIGVLSGMPAQVPEQGRKLVLAPLARAHHNAADAAYELERYDEAVTRHRQGLAVQSELARLAPKDIDVQLDLGRQHARLARALHEAKSYAEAREQSAQARALFTLFRDAAKNPQSVDRLIGYVDGLLTTIAKSEVPLTPAAR
jgi:tetratricopeptide (TPR) repeat protein